MCSSLFHQCSQPTDVEADGMTDGRIEMPGEPSRYLCDVPAGTGCRKHEANMICLHHDLFHTGTWNLAIPTIA